VSSWQLRWKWVTLPGARAAPAGKGRENAAASGGGERPGRRGLARAVAAEPPRGGGGESERIRARGGPRGARARKGPRRQARGARLAVEKGCNEYVMLRTGRRAGKRSLRRPACYVPARQGRGAPGWGRLPLRGALRRRPGGARRAGGGGPGGRRRVLGRGWVGSSPRRPVPSVVLAPRRSPTRRVVAGRPRRRRAVRGPRRSSGRRSRGPPYPPTGPCTAWIPPSRSPRLTGTAGPPAASGGGTGRWVRRGRASLTPRAGPWACRAGGARRASGW
jgi:hypothetical protein